MSNHNNTDVTLVGLSVIFLQVADGLLTFIGVSKLGIRAEGNPLLSSLMESYGVGNTLLITKFLAIVVCLMLIKLSEKFEPVKPALICVCVIYTLFAVLPWSIILVNGI